MVFFASIITMMGEYMTKPRRYGIFLKKIRFFRTFFSKYYPLGIEIDYFCILSK